MAPALLSLKYSESKGKVIGIYNASIHIGLTTGPIIAILLFKLWSDNHIFLFYAILCLIGAIINFYCLENKLNKKALLEKATALNEALLLFRNPYILLVFLGIAFYGAGYGIFPTIVPAFLITEKNFDSYFIYLYFSLFYASISLSQLITGYLSDKMGRRLFMIIGLIVSAVGLWMIPGFNQLGLIIVLSISTLGLGIFYLSSMAYINESVPDSFKGTITGTYYVFWGIGMLLGPMILSNYVEYTNSYYAGFYWFALLLVFIAIVLFILSPKNNVGNNNKLNIHSRKD